MMENVHQEKSMNSEDVLKNKLAGFQNVPNSTKVLNDDLGSKDKVPLVPEGKKKFDFTKSPKPVQFSLL